MSKCKENLCQNITEILAESDRQERKFSRFSVRLLEECKILR